MKFNPYSEKLKIKTSGELIIFILVPVFTFLVASVTHLADFFDRIIHRSQTSLAGELIITCIVFAVITWMYTINRMKEYKQSVISLKGMQEATRKSEERFYLASQATMDIIYEWNAVNNEVWISDHIFSSFGYNKSETAITIEWWMSKVHPDDIDRVMETSHEYIEQKKHTWIDEYRFRKADGSYAFVYDRAHIAYDENGNFLRWIGSMTDITEMKNIQEKLHLTKEKAEESVKIATNKVIAGRPKVNIQRLFADLDKSDDKMEKILTLFEEDALRLLKDIELAVKTGHMAVAATFLHTLRGQCGLVDMHTANEIALELEIHAANKQSSKVEQLLPRLSQELRESLGEMQIIQPLTNDQWLKRKMTHV
jgi:PAS domain S-box-containing protein